jgi:hypothetical protein
MPTNLDKAITKLSDRGVQSRLRAAMRTATVEALKKEGIELSPAEWGELTARMIAAKPDLIHPDFDWGQSHSYCDRDPGCSVRPSIEDEYRSQ